MRILVTGAKGFVGKNLCSQLNNIKEGKARWYGDLLIDEVYEYDLDSTPEQLDKWCKDCDFVFKRNSYHAYFSNRSKRFRRQKPLLPTE